MDNKIDPRARICIIGAGPAGLTHAHYLKKAGYNNVHLLEINSEVGGKSHTLTFNNRSFDMGANYLTPDYTHIMEMAAEYGAKMYHEKAPIAFNPSTGKFQSLMSAVLKDTSLFAFIWSSIRYLFIRWKLNIALPKAGNIGLTTKSDLMVSFDEWLENNKLGNLRHIFSIPTTMMGYGDLNSIPAPYVLRYIGVGTFRCMLLFGAKISMAYPKRFVDGFQRFWQRVSWGLDIRTNVHVVDIKREQGKVNVKFNIMRINDAGPSSDSFNEEYDYLVLSCPLTVKTLLPFLDLRDNEKAMFNSDKVKYNTFGIVLLNDTSKVKFDWRVFHIFPLATINHPAIFAHQFPENPAFEIYTPMTTIDDESHESLHNRIKNIEGQSISVIKNIGGNSSEEDVLHYDIWKYFYHVSLEDFKAGYFDELEKMQGQHNTFYNMGLNSFELIEPIARYSKYLVDRYYIGKIES
jgi:hypothetical protein